MIKHLKVLRTGDLYKNIIILIPFILNGKFEYENNLILFVKSFIALSIINLLCYLINDFTDQKIDKK